MKLLSLLSTSFLFAVVTLQGHALCTPSLTCTSPAGFRKFMASSCASKGKCRETFRNTKYCDAHARDSGYEAPECDQ